MLTRQRLLLTVLCGVELLMVQNAWAFSILDIPGELAEPGVKLVAVEFYATWCKPCQAAVPKWRLLQDKYRALGLRLIVVSVQSEGTCASPEWTPDAVVCDSDGKIAKKWDAKNLPQAFLWNWQGNLLVEHGSVELVEKGVKVYFQNAPRILIDEPTDSNGGKLPDEEGAELKRMVSEELTSAAKIDLPLSEEERSKLREIRSKSSNAAYAEDQRCALGEEVAPNSLLKVIRVQSKSGDKLRLELISLEKGCLTAAAVATVSDGNFEAAVKSAVEKLLLLLHGEPKTPKADKTSSAVSDSKPMIPVAVPMDLETLQKRAEALHKRDEALQALRQTIAAEFEKVRPLAQDEILPKEERIAALKAFLKHYPDHNPKKEETESLIKDIRAGGHTKRLQGEKRRSDWQWFSFSIIGGNYGGGGRISLPVWRFSHFFWELVHFSGSGGTKANLKNSERKYNYFLEVGTVVGVPFFLDAAYNHEFRLGAGISAGFATNGCRSLPNRSYRYDCKESLGPFVNLSFGYLYHVSPNIALEFGFRTLLVVAKGAEANDRSVVPPYNDQFRAAYLPNSYYSSYMGLCFY